MDTGQSEITEIYDFLGHFFGLYLAGECQNVLEIARFVRFRQRRCGFKKIPWKNKKFSQSYSFLKIAEMFAIFQFSERNRMTRLSGTVTYELV